MNKTWFVSDWHFCHDKPFVYEPRGFKTVEEMNETIIKNHNSLVDYDDDVYCLGDCMLMDNETGIKCIKSLKGKIHIIRGNHCTNNRVELYSKCYNVVEVLGYADIIKINGYHFYLSHYPTITSNYDIDKPLKCRVINLCGHSHTKDKFQDMDKGLIFHVELDTNNCYPWLIDDLIAEIQQYTGQK